PGAGTAAVAGPAAVAAMDFDGDGKPDLAELAGSTVLILRGAGDGTFTAGASYDLGTDAGAILAADFNGDGKPDLAVLRHDGSGRGVAVGDFTRDGRPDLAVTAGSTLDLLTGDGAGGFTVTGSYAPTSGGITGDVVVGDFLGTGQPAAAVWLADVGAMIVT